MAWGLVYAPGRHDCAEELEAANVHASLLLMTLRQPDAEAVRGEIGGARQPEDFVLRPRTIRGPHENVPSLTIEGFEDPIYKGLCIAAGNPEAESRKLQLEGDLVLNPRARSQAALSTTAELPIRPYVRIDRGRRYIRGVGFNLPESPSMDTPPNPMNRDSEPRGRCRCIF